MVMICSISLICLVQHIPVRLTLSVLSISSPSRCSVPGANYDEDSEEQDEYEDHNGDEYDFQPSRVNRSLSVGHPSSQLKTAGVAQCWLRGRRSGSRPYGSGRN